MDGALLWIFTKMQEPVQKLFRATTFEFPGVRITILDFSRTLFNLSWALVSDVLQLAKPPSARMM